MEILRTEDLKKHYSNGENIVKALDGANISIEKGEFAAVVGTSGSGKTTLLQMIGGLDTPTEGKVFLNGEDIFSLNDNELTIFRRRNIGFVFQAYNLIPALSVYENIIFTVSIDDNKPDFEFIDEVIETLGLKEKINCMPYQLSGGQQQRVAIARALASKPSVILADEPTGNLDSKTSMDVIGLLKVTAQKYNQTMIIITHDEEIAQMADRIIRIEDGKIVKGGSDGC